MISITMTSLVVYSAGGLAGVWAVCVCCMEAAVDAGTFTRGVIHRGATAVCAGSSVSGTGPLLWENFKVETTQEDSLAAAAAAATATAVLPHRRWLPPNSL